VIKELQGRLKVRIQIPNQPDPGQIFRSCVISGPSIELCNMAKAQVEQICSDQTTSNVMSGVNNGYGNVGATTYPVYGNQMYGAQQQYGQQQQNPYGAQQQQYGMQQQQQQQAGQKDYSAEWAQYYAAQAAAQAGQGQQFQQQQVTAPAPAPAPAQAPAPAPASNSTSTTESATATNTQDPTAYYAQFWEYTKYYGEDAARKFYKQWSPPVGTPNPNGGAASAAAPAAAPAPAPAAAATNGGQRVYQDSSQRQVSNLPAWMNK